MKTNKNKIKIEDDERWGEYNKLKKEGKILEANKLKNKILASNKFIKQCHHVDGICV